LKNIFQKISFHSSGSILADKCRLFWRAPASSGSRRRVTRISASWQERRFSGEARHGMRRELRACRADAAGGKKAGNQRFQKNGAQKIGA
jgi:hypothetical protein